MNDCINDNNNNNIKTVVNKTHILYSGSSAMASRCLFLKESRTKVVLILGMILFPWYVGFSRLSSELSLSPSLWKSDSKVNVTGNGLKCCIISSADYRILSSRYSAHTIRYTQCAPYYYNNFCWSKKLIFLAVVVAQLVEQSLPVPEVHCSNPVIGKKLYWTFSVNCIKKTKIKKKMPPGMAHF